MVGFPNNHGFFYTKNDHFGVFWGYHHLREHPYLHLKYMCAATPTFARAALVRPFCATFLMLGSDAPSALNPTLKP